MTTCRALVLALLLAAAQAGAQTTSPVAASSNPAATPASGGTTPAVQDATWALAEFSGGGVWAARLPLLVARGWDRLPDHRLTDTEKVLLNAKAIDAAVAALRKQSSQTRLDLDKKKISGTLPAGEPDATEKTLSGLDAQIAQAQAGTGVALAPDTMALRPVWPSDKTGLPWNAADGPTIAARAGTLYAVTGAVAYIDGYLQVDLSLYSSIENRFLASWSGQFAPDEAPARMADAADALRAALLGRPWAGVKITSPLSGTRVQVAGVWHDLPWSSDTLEPGDLPIVITAPGQAPQNRTLTLEASRRASLDLNFTAVPDTITLETDPPGASLYLDSRYLGPSPQTVDRPLATARVRAQAPGYATRAWEIGPRTPSPSKITLLPPSEPVSVPDAKDRFYWSLAAFSFSLTSTAFLGAWQQEQAGLTSQYALDGTNIDNYNKAYFRYKAVTYAYAGAVVLTSAIFVWMMFELGSYLAADESTLP